MWLVRYGQAALALSSVASQATAPVHVDGIPKSRLPANLPRVDFAQILNGPSRLMRLELLHRMSARRYRQNFCVDSFGAGDIQGRIADHQNFLAGQISS